MILKKIKELKDLGFIPNDVNLKEPYIKLEHENGDIFQFNFKDFDNLKTILNTIFGFYRMQFCLHYWCYLDDKNSDCQGLIFTDDAEVISMGEIYNYDLSKELPKFDYNKNIEMIKMKEDLNKGLESAKLVGEMLTNKITIDEMIEKSRLIWNIKRT